MARKRMIDPNFWQSEDVSKLSVFERLVFIGLISNADDYGRGRANASYLKSMIFPYDEIRVADMEKALLHISQNTSVNLYEVSGQRYYSLKNWDKWQKVGHPIDSIIPAYDSFHESFMNQSREPHESFTPNIIKDNISQDKLIQDNMSDFETFYQTYPRHEGRGQAEKAYKAALNFTTCDNLLKSCQAYADHHAAAGTNKQYIKLPATWLNGKCWEDELIEPNQRGKPKQSFLDMLGEIVNDKEGVIDV